MNFPDPSINLSNDWMQCYIYGVIQVLRNAVGVGRVRFLGKKRYKGVQHNITRGWVGSNFHEKSILLYLNSPNELSLLVACIMFVSPQAMVITQENLLFLSTMMHWFESIHSCLEPPLMLQLFPPLIHTLLLVWSHSK